MSIKYRRQLQGWAEKVEVTSVQDCKKQLCATFSFPSVFKTSLGTDDCLLQYV